MDPSLIEEYKQQLKDQQNQFNDCICVFTGALEAVLSLQTHQDVFYYGSHDGPIRSFNLKSGRRTQVLRGHRSWVNDIIIGGDRRTLFSCSRDGDIRCWDLEKNGECTKIFSSPQVPLKGIKKVPQIPINCMALHTHGEILASGGSDGNVLLWDVNTEEMRKIYSGHASSISAVKFRENHLYSASWDSFTKIVDVETDSVISVIKASDTPVKSISLSKDDENLLVVGCGNGNLYLYDTRTNELVRMLRGHTECVLCITVYKDYVFTGSDDTYCIQWDLREGKVLHIYSGHQDAVRCISITEEGDVYTGSFDHSVRRWDMNGVVKLLEEEMKVNEQIRLLEGQLSEKSSGQRKLSKSESSPKRSGTVSKRSDSNRSRSSSRDSNSVASRRSSTTSSSKEKVSLSILKENKKK